VAAGKVSRARGAMKAREVAYLITYSSGKISPTSECIDINESFYI
jgi:hypothetical protein